MRVVPDVGWQPADPIKFGFRRVDAGGRLPTGGPSGLTASGGGMLPRQAAKKLVERFEVELWQGLRMVAKFERTPKGER